MIESIVRKTPCWYCLNKEYTSRYDSTGRYYTDWNCFYPHNHARFGRIKEAAECLDYQSESEVDARLSGGL